MRIYPVFIPQAGCPHHCVFCEQQRLTGGAQIPSAAQLALTLDTLLPAQGDGEIAFYGGSFTLLALRRQQDYLAVAGRLVTAGRVAGIRLSTRPDALGEETVDQLRSAGVTTVEIGVQSFSDSVLRAAGRGHKAGEVPAAVGRLRLAGIGVGLQLMPGLPGGDRAEAVDSLLRALQLGPDFLRIYPTVVLTGTALEARWRAGSYHPLDLRESVDWCAEMLWRCRQAQIPVVRLGLQATAELDAGAAVAGPYHPAFGQLVRSHLWRRALQRLGSTGARAVGVAPADLAEALGQRRENLHFLQRRFGDFNLLADATAMRGELLLEERRYQLDSLAAY